MIVALLLNQKNKLHLKAFYSCYERLNQFKNVSVKKEEDELPITIIKIKITRSSMYWCCMSPYPTVAIDITIS